MNFYFKFFLFYFKFNFFEIKNIIFNFKLYKLLSQNNIKLINLNLLLIKSNNSKLLFFWLHYNLIRFAFFIKLFYDNCILHAIVYFLSIFQANNS